MTTKKSWRDLLQVHPAANLFPMMSESELLELGKDIKEHGLKEPICLYMDAALGLCVLDGRNRLTAMEMVGRYDFGHLHSVSDRHLPASCRLVGPADSFAYVISKNIQRRHLTAEQKRDAIAKLSEGEARAIQSTDCQAG